MLAPTTMTPMPGERDKEKLQCPRCGGSGVVSVPLAHPPITDTDWEQQACSRCGGHGMVVVERGITLGEVWNFWWKGKFYMYFAIVAIVVVVLFWAYTWLAELVRQLVG